MYCHSVVLRARTPFFEAFFGEEEWTRERWDEGGSGVLSVELRHLRWRGMEWVVRFMVCGEEEGMFDGLGGSFRYVIVTWEHDTDYGSNRFH